MRLLRSIQNHPGVVFAAVAAGFVAWIAANPPRDPSRSAAEIPAVDVPAAAVLVPAPPGVCTPASLAQLRPGMPRVEVEGVLGPPPADRVLPFDRDTATYLTTYPALFGPTPPAPVGRRALPPPVAPDQRVAVEFDASRPGHPLVRVHYPDPLF